MKNNEITRKNQETYDIQQLKLSAEQNEKIAQEEKQRNELIIQEMQKCKKELASLNIEKSKLENDLIKLKEQYTKNTKDDQIVDESETKEEEDQSLVSAIQELCLIILSKVFFFY